MPLQNLITDLSQTASANTFAGSDAPSLIDDQIRNIHSFIAQLRDGAVASALKSTSLGSVSFPAFSFAGDTDTGVYSPSGNVLSFATGGVDRLQLTSSAATVYQDLTVSRTSGNTPRMILGQAGIVNWVVQNTASSGKFSINVGGADLFAIDTSGNVVHNVNASAPSLDANSQMVFSLTSNTNLRISVRGTDGVTRSINLTIA